MTNYHAHIYYNLQDLDMAELLFQKAKSQTSLFKTWKLYDRMVGPHTKPMFELQFTSETKDQTIAWIKANVGPWSVLIHEDTGDDVRDHTEGHAWLGEKLPINFSFFQLIQQDPSLAIHQN